jgi:RNA polymerase sigma-70 factor (ECF subfamily)
MSRAQKAPQPALEHPADQSKGPEFWVDLHGDYLYRYALMRMREPAAAEEVVQETLLAALESYDRFSGAASERTWLVGILKHKILDHFRRASRLTSFDSLEGLPAEPESVFMHSGDWPDHFDPNLGPADWHASPAEVLEQTEFREVLGQCLMGLPDRLATVFTLREMEELKTEEICKVLNISSTNLWVMLHRARAHLRLCIENKWFRQTH